MIPHLAPGELSPEERVLQSHLEDMIMISLRTGRARFSAFLTSREQQIAMAAAGRMGLVGYRFFSGYEGGERAVFGVSDGDGGPDPSLFPIRAVTIRYRKADRLNHRDILGALMSLLIKRQSVGDILIGEGQAALFVLDSVQPLALAMDRVGGVGVSCAAGLPDPLPSGPALVDVEGVVSSMRLDCLVSMLAGVSRGEADRLIRSGLVSRQGVRTENPSGQVSEGETISIRGYGKYMLCARGANTRKGRIHVRCKKYS